MSEQPNIENPQEVENVLGEHDLNLHSLKGLFILVSGFDGTISDIKPSAVGPLKILEVKSDLYEKEGVRHEHSSIELNSVLSVQGKFPDVLRSFGGGVIPTPKGYYISLERFYMLVRKNSKEADFRILEIRLRNFYEGLRTSGDMTYFSVEQLLVDQLLTERLRFKESHPELSPLTYTEDQLAEIDQLRRVQYEFKQWYAALTQKFAPPPQAE